MTQKPLKYQILKQNQKQKIDRSTDNLWNVESVQTSNLVKIDKQAPTLSFTNNVAVWPVTSDTIVASRWWASVTKRDYFATSSCPTSAWSYSNSTSTITTQTTETNNTKYICLYAEDNLWNYATLASSNDINIDITAPTKPVCTNSQYFSGSLSLTCTSNGTIRYTTSTTVAPTCSSSIWSNTAISTTSTYYILACDALWNKTSSTLYKYIADNEAPDITITQDPVWFTSWNVDLNYSVYDSGVGLSGLVLPDNTTLVFTATQTLLDYTEWILWTDGNQWNFVQNGATAENQIINKIDRSHHSPVLLDNQL